MSAASFRPDHRIRKQVDFERVYQARAYAADDVLVINGNVNGLTHPRLGLSVSKRVGTAVVRNRWKRLIREAFRLAREELPVGIDLVVRPQTDAAADFADICRSLPALARRIARKLGSRREETGDSEQGTGVSKEANGRRTRPEST